MYNDKETGELRPGSKGISLTPEQFEKLVGSLDGIKAALGAAKPAADAEEEEEAGEKDEEEGGGEAAPPTKKSKKAAASAAAADTVKDE
jgi:hypothetical protein